MQTEQPKWQHKQRLPAPREGTNNTSGAELEVRRMKKKREELEIGVCIDKH